MRKYVIRGPQGSGKATQAKMLVDDLDGGPRSRRV